MTTNDGEDSFVLFWEGSNGVVCCFEEQEGTDSFSGNLYLQQWGENEQVLGWQPVYVSKASRAEEVKDSVFIWDADGRGGTFRFDGKQIRLVPASPKYDPTPENIKRMREGKPPLPAQAA